VSPPEHGNPDSIQPETVLSMNGQSVVITGGASGLGLATAALMCERGARVALIDINEGALESAVAGLRARGFEAHPVTGDITRRDTAHAAFDTAAAALGTVDALVNCAGVYPRRPILEIDDADWEFSFAVNVRGTYHLCVAAIEHMRPRRAGRIVNVSSVDAFKAHPANAHYAAMKAAVVSLTRSLALELAPEQILINGVAPAAIATEKAKQAGFLPELSAQNPLGRAAEPEDIGEVIVFLASPANRYITGETVIVSGGYVIA